MTNEKFVASLGDMLSRKKAEYDNVNEKKAWIGGQISMLSFVISELESEKPTNNRDYNTEEEYS